MELSPLFTALDWPDAAAAAYLVLAWLGMGWWVENSGSRPSVARLMTRHRKSWMLNHITRDPRVFDAMLLGSLREGTAFFASACLIAIGGGLALLGNTDRISAVAQEFMIDPAPAMVWEIKVLAPVLLITNAFLKFVWSHRVFGYSAVMMGAIPNDENAPETRTRALVAADLNIDAARAFNRGMRSVYFALGSLGWLLGPAALTLTTTIAVATVWHREFNSASRLALLRAEADDQTS